MENSKFAGHRPAQDLEHFNIPSGSDSLWKIGGFCHKPLPRGPWIRLFKMEPGDSHDPLKCSVQHVLLADVVGQYDTLSYVWGEKTCARIHVDGSPFTIRENLVRFLLDLRSSGQSSFMWADAICIDQENSDEKNHQVAQMSSIFKSSHTTRIWLGQSYLNIDLPYLTSTLATMLPEGIPARHDRRCTFCSR